MPRSSKNPRQATKIEALRSRTMRAVKSRDTSPERAVRKLLHSIAPGYRLDRRDLPGRPDIAYIGRKKAIFVHGCFWHGHDCKRGARTPKSNAAYWIAKIDRNRRRDERARQALEGGGWDVCTIWECELRSPADVRVRLERLLAGAIPNS